MKRFTENVYIISSLGALLSVLVLSLVVGVIYLLMPQMKLELNDSFKVNLNDQLSSNLVDSITEVKTFQDEILAQKILDYLGEDRAAHYGIFLYDLKTNEIVFQYRQRELLPSASISKLPSVILTLKDVDEGKYSLEDTIAVKNTQKHTNIDAIGKHAQGTRLPISLFVEEAIRTSNNSAHYHLHDNLGGAGVVNPRTQNELNAGQFFLDPLWARTEDVGQVLIDLYNRDILSEQLSQYLIDLMINAAPSLKTAIPAGVPENIEVANKVGFLFGGQYGNTFADAGIVFGNNTDYVLVVLNDKTTPFPSGAEPIREMSKIIYKHMEERSYSIN